MSKVFNISVEWQMEGTFQIEAETLREAINEAYDRQDFPHDQQYVDGSFRVQSGLQDQKEEAQ